MDKPSLPTDAFDFCDATKEWFDTWRSDPCTDGWDARHWQYMFDTAIVHSAVYGSYNFALLGELDRRERYMGLTFAQGGQTGKRREAKVLQFVQQDRAKRHADAKNSA